MPAQAGIQSADLDPRFRGGRLRSPVERGETARPLALRSAELRATELSGVTAPPLWPEVAGETRRGYTVSVARTDALLANLAWGLRGIIAIGP